MPRVLAPRFPGGCRFLREGEIQRLARILLIVYFLETGVVLLVAPWTFIWERNWLVETLPFWGGFARLDGVRGAVSGLGLVSLGVAASELTVVLGAAIRCRRGSGAEPPPAPAVERTLAEEAGSWPRKS